MRFGETMIQIHLYQSSLTNETRILKITKSIESSRVFSRIVVCGVRSEDTRPKESVSSVIAFHRYGPARTGFWKKVPAFRAVQLALWAIEVLVSWTLLCREKIGCVNAHSLVCLPLCWFIARYHGAKLVYDTHELETETNGASGFRKKVSKWLERFLIYRVDWVVLVTPQIEAWYRAEYSIQNCCTVRNIPSISVEEWKGNLRQQCGIPQEELIFCYVGLFAKGRGSEAVVEAFSKIKKGHVVFVGFGPLEPDLRKAAAQNPRVHVLPAVPPQQVVSFCKQIDIGFALGEKVGLSYEYSLPNKLFEYLAAGAPVIVSNIESQMKFVEEFQVGWVSPVSSSDLLATVEAITQEQFQTAKKHVAATATKLSWDSEMSKTLWWYREMCTEVQ